MKSIIATAAIALFTLASTHAEVRTYQGSTRWAATLYTPGVRTTNASTSYTSYFIVETSGDLVINAVKIDAWTTRSGRFYYVDNDFSIEYGYFGLYGTELAGGMQFGDFDVLMAFRGSQRSGRLDSFTLFPAVDYYPNDDNLDITTITGSARFNAYFSGNISLNTAANAVLDFLESRGFYEY